MEYEYPTRRVRRTRRIRRLVSAGAVLGAFVGAVGCSGAPGGSPGVEAEPDGSERATGAPAMDAVVVPERWISQGDTLFDLDTPALWTDGTVGQVLVTAKGTHDLKVFDAETGATLASIGSEGPAAGQFQRPNAVLVVDDLAFVVERDNHRVQVLGAPDWASLGWFGETELEYPYGAVIDGSLPVLTFWITDDYEVSPGAQPDYTRRLHRFEVEVAEDGTATVLNHAAFGEPDGEGALAVVESIGLDADAERILVADEDRRAFLQYGMDGRFAGGIALGEGLIEGDPEGIALVSCRGSDEGFWLVTDQRPEVSLFHVFERGSLDFVGTFRGEHTANTDGVTFAPGPVPGFPEGAFFTVHDDQALSAFAWSDIETQLGLPAQCL